MLIWYLPAESPAGTLSSVVPTPAVWTAEKEGHRTDAGTFTLQPKDYALQEVSTRRTPAGHRRRQPTDLWHAATDLPTAGHQRVRSPQTTSGRYRTERCTDTGRQAESVCCWTDVLVHDLRTTHHLFKGYAGLARGKSGSDAPALLPQYHVRGAAINLYWKDINPAKEACGEVNGEYKQRR